MFDQLDIVEERYEQLNELLSDPDVVNDADTVSYTHLTLPTNREV